MAVIKRGVHGNVLTAACSGGSSFIIPPDIQHRYHLTEGMELSEEETQKLMHECRVHQAGEKAVAFLASREHSRRELEQKLAQRGFSPEEIAPALGSLEKRGLQSDRRFAEQWVRSRAERMAEGPVKLAAGLQARGIEQSLAQEVTDAVISECGRINMLNRAYEKLLPKSRGIRERLIASLVRKGFSYHEVCRFLENIEDSDAWDG